MKIDLQLTPEETATMRVLCDHLTKVWKRRGQPVTPEEVLRNFIRSAHTAETDAIGRTK